jgi:hypothetical protein
LVELFFKDDAVATFISTTDGNPAMLVVKSHHVPGLY